MAIGELRDIWRFIGSHPLTRDHRLSALGRVLGWQLRSRVAAGPIVVPFVGDTRLAMRRGMRGATGNYYVGLMEFEDMAFLLHFLRGDELFADVGANVGVYSVLAAGVCGARAVAFEPVLAAAAGLRENIRLNRLEARIELHEMGVAADPGRLGFTTDADTMNRVTEDGASLPVTTLDAVFGEDCPALIKIDVEGYEASVLAGGAKCLANETLKALIVELNGSGRIYGFDDRAVHESLLGHGFAAYAYAPFERRLSRLEGHGSHNTLYLRNPPFVAARIAEATPFRVLGHII